MNTPAIPMDQIEPVLHRIDSFCRQLSPTLGERMLRGALEELKVHFLQRNIEGALCTDLDFILMRFDTGTARPAALIEIKKAGRELKDWQREVYSHIAKALGVPFFLLEATDGHSFSVLEMNQDVRFGPMNIERLGQWMRSLVTGGEFHNDDRDLDMRRFI